MSYVTGAITSALNAPGHPRYELIHDTILCLTGVEGRPLSYEGTAYEWCAVIWENSQSYKDWEGLFLSLEFGFRHHDPHRCRVSFDLPHTENHREFTKAVFKSNRHEAIEDLLCALVMHCSGEPAIKSFGFCKWYIVDLLNGSVTAPISPRLLQLIIRSIGLIGYRGFEEVRPGQTVELLNHLRIGVGDIPWPSSLTSMLMEAIKSAKAPQSLAIQVWESLARSAIFRSRTLMSVTTYDPHVTDFLLDAQEWEKLECWLGIVWMTWLSETDDVTEEVKHATNLLFRQKPAAVQKHTQWMEEWSGLEKKPIPGTFQQICEQARQEAV